MLTDSELLRRYAEEKSDDAFAELVRRHVDLVYSAAMRQVNGDAHRAKDVAQVVFTTLARKAPKLTSHPVLAGWLYTATHHAAARTVRSESRRRLREQAALHMQHSASDPAASIDWDAVRPVLDDAMRDLSEPDREAVILRFFARRTFADIGAALNVTEDAARMRVDRALDKLHGLLERRGISSTTSALAMILAQEAVVAAPASLAATLTGAALTTAGTATVDLLSYMTTTKLISVSAAALAILSLGTSIHFVRRDHAGAVALDTARQSHATLLARQRDATTRADAAAARVTTLEESLVETRNAVAAAIKADRDRSAKPAATPSPEPQVPADRVAAGNAFLAANPPVKQALVERSRARVASRFLPLYQELSLTPAQIERFEQIQIETEGIGAQDMLLRPGTGMTGDEMRRQTRELLGDSGFAKYSEEVGKISARVLATDLAAALYFTETPLSAAQAREFVDTVFALDRQRGSPAAYRDWDELIAKLQGVLLPRQLSAVDALRQQEAYQQAVLQASGGRKF
jgi:RNA polymerase sigma factor (sigma-70 family)